MSTLGIWDSWINSAYSHVNPDKGNTVSPDKRGGHRVGMVSQMSEVKTASVKEHVNSFPRVPSHYCRRRTKREYLQKGLSISRMAKLYKKWAKEKNLPQASIATPRQYRDILNANFNLGFYKPKKDRCSFCSVMRDKKNSRQIREERKAEWVVHVRNKERSRKLKEKDKTAGTKDKKTAVLSFDLQKQLQCPQSESSSFYYRRKLCVFNFTIFNMIEREGVCFLWHEGIGKKGSDEICSALYIYIEELVKRGYKVFIFWSDNCAGQNKNRNLFAMYEYLAVKHGIVITHKYLEPGHTQMEVDSIHANIERASEKQDIFDFNDWVEIIESAKTESPMYRVVTLTQKDIVSFKPIVSKQNWDFDLARARITWKKVKVVTVNGNEGNMVRVKYDYDAASWVTLSPNKRGNPMNFKTYKPPLAYDSHLPLTKGKIEDITWLCDNYHVPQQKQEFLRNVLAGVYPVDEEEVSDLEYDSEEERCCDRSDHEDNSEDEEISEEEDDSDAADTPGEEGDMASLESWDT